MLQLLVPVLLLASATPVDGIAATTRITILVDAFGARDDLRRDWGYAALVEHGDTRILFDTGNDSELFRHNVEGLGINLADLDFVVISHRHGDHTDGLRYLLEVNPGVRIYVANDEYFGGPTPRVFFRDSVPSLPPHMRYFGGQVPDPVPHGSPWKHANLERISGERTLGNGIRVVANVAREGAFTETPELSLVIDTDTGPVVLVGCSHPGIERILESAGAGTTPVRAVVGGLHWVTAPEADVERRVRALHEEWRVDTVAPGHCTGEVGFAALQRVFGRRYAYAGVGSTLEF
jgi:7,8-dihydropterin-6-yl-methyl-4-(beta-D-ribofuranosyl)aminobenzene 5'-phosphate synthase